MKNFKRNCGIIMGMIIVTFGVFIYSIIKPFLGYSAIDDFGEGTTIGVINKDVTINQKFISQLENLDSIQIQFATFNHKNERGTLIVEIYNDMNEKIYYNEYKLNELQDNDSLKFEFGVQKNTKNKEYNLVISTKDVTSEEVVTFHAVSNEEMKVTTKDKIDISDTIRIYQYGEDRSYFYAFVFLIIFFIELFILFIYNFKYFKLDFNNKKRVYKCIYYISLLPLSLILSCSLVNIGMHVFYENRISYLSMALFIITTILFLLNLAYHICNKNFKIEKLFLALAIPLGSLYLICLIPGNIPDEPYHYRIAYQVAKGNFKLRNNSSPTSGNKVYMNYASAKNELFTTKYDNEGTYFFKNGGYSPILYLFSGFGIFLGKILGLPILATKYMASFSNFLLFLIGGYFILKTLPYGKYMGLVYLLSPMNLQQSTSISCDAAINIICLSFIAYILRLHKEAKPLTKKNIVILAILSFLIYICKNAYLPLYLLLFLLRKNVKNSDKKQKKRIWIAIILIIVCCIGTKLYNEYNASLKAAHAPTVEIKSRVENVVRTVEDDLVVPQPKYTKLGYLLTNPIRVIQLILNTIKVNGNFYIGSFVGEHLGALNIDIPLYIVFVYLILLFISTFFDSNKNNLNSIDKLIIFATLLINFCGILAPLFLWWGNVRDLSIEGVQGRYFIPFFILIFYIISYKHLKLNVKHKGLLIASLLLFINVYAIITVVCYYLV